MSLSRHGNSSKDGRTSGGCRERESDLPRQQLQMILAQTIMGFRAWTRLSRIQASLRYSSQPWLVYANTLGRSENWLEPRYADTPQTMFTPIHASWRLRHGPGAASTRADGCDQPPCSPCFKMAQRACASNAESSGIGRFMSPISGAILSSSAARLKLGPPQYG